MKFFHRSISMILVLVCMLSLVYMPAFADGEIAVEDISAEEETAASEEVFTQDLSEENPESELSSEEKLVPAEEQETEDIPEEKSVSGDSVDTGATEDEESADTAEPEEDEPADAGEAEAPAEDAAVAEESEPSEEIAVEEPVVEEPVLDGEREYHWTAPGNDDVAILDGGSMLISGECFYYVDNGIWMDANGSTSYIAPGNAGNLNLADGWLYYTVGTEVRRVPADGGTVETVHTAAGQIGNLYVMGWEIRYLFDGCIWSFDLRDGTVISCAAPAGTVAFIPAPYGDLYLTGAPRDYTLCNDSGVLLRGVIQCYSEGEWLVVVNSSGTWQVSFADLFEGNVSLQNYSLYQDIVEELSDNGLTEEEEIANEAAFLLSDTYIEMYPDAYDAVPIDGDYYYTSSNSKIASLASSTASTNVTNIRLRARQMAEVEWTPLSWRYSWGGNDSSYVENNKNWGSKVTATDGTSTLGYFASGKTYRGVPYSQAVYTGYVGWNISLSNFVKAVNNSSSVFYQKYSTFSRTAPYYGSDCSGFVSWAWDVSVRRTCTSLLNDSNYIGEYISQLQVGDCLNWSTSHVVLITDIAYDSSGKMVSIEITEQTPCKMRVSCYGQLIPGRYYDNHYSDVNRVQTSYLNGSYSIYRRKNIDVSGQVSFTESDAVDLDKGSYAAAPSIAVTVNTGGNAKVVTLKHRDTSLDIYYTLDGSEPTTSSTKYTGPFEVSKDTTVRAVADVGDKYKGSYILTYEILVTKADVPFIAVVDGDMAPVGNKHYVSSGTVIALINENMDTVYYTTDGSEPDRNSKKAPLTGITITGNTVIKAVAVSEEELNSDVVTLTIELGKFHNITASGTLGGVISPSGVTGVLEGADYTFTVKADDRYDVKEVLVDGNTASLTNGSYTFKNVTKDHTISVTFAVDLPFTDLVEKWYEPSVQFCYSQNLFSGTSATKFSPYDGMTRGMFITVLGRFAKAGTDLESWSGNLGITNGSFIYVRETTNTSDTSRIVAQTGTTGEHLTVLEKVPYGQDGGVWYKVNYKDKQGYMRETTTGSNPKTLLYAYDGAFTDLPNGEYFTGYAQWGYINDIVKGYSSTSYGPYNYITREDICVLLYRYLTEYMNISITVNTAPFGDNEYISGYAKTAVYAMKSIGVVNGYDDGKFYPFLNATRAEVACMFTNLFKYLNGTNS